MTEKKRIFPEGFYYQASERREQAVTKWMLAHDRASEERKNFLPFTSDTQVPYDFITAL